tara:strand:- start:523 stop:732 length:210 start_codon:yes stop_codon:yes gene_type:complete
MDLPRNFASFYDKIEVQCHKCVDNFLFTKWKDAINDSKFLKQKVVSKPVEKVEFEDDEVKSIKSFTDSA